MIDQQKLAIEARGLTRRFGDLVAVDGLNLSVPESMIYGFLGPNGSGKSTSIRMICGLLTPTDGSVRVLGKDIPREAEALKPDIGYMTQKFSLYDDMTVLENLQFVGGIYSIARSQRKQRIEELLAVFELAEVARQFAGTMSGGQRQRLALAAATMHRPKLLLLDEPTSAVDPKSRRDFWAKLFELAELGTTILVSTHYMDEAERCHRLAILDHGAKVADGSPQELQDNIGMSIVEVSSNDPYVAQDLLSAVPEVFSITQLGLRLRVLVTPGVADPESLVGAALQSVRLQSSIRLVKANLEDVFVAVTQKPARELPA